MGNLQIICSPKYINYDFGPDHPFWAERAQVFLNKIKNKNFEYKILEPPKGTDEEILLVHTPNYLKDVKNKAAINTMLTPDTPMSTAVLNAAYYSVGGSILAARQALKGNKAVNLLGGLHHAGPNYGGGFCIFADHAIAIRKLQQESIIKKAIIFDLDAHAGNGTQEIFYEDPNVFNISLHQDPRTLYPGTGFKYQTGSGAGEGYNLNVPLPANTAGNRFLKELDKVLQLREDFQPDLTVLILGADTYKGDPLTNLQLDKEDYCKIGSRFRSFENLAVFFAGGYSKKTPDLWLNFINGLTNEVFKNNE